MLQQDEITDPWPEGHSSEVLSKKLDMVVFLLDGSTMTFFRADGEMDLE